MDQAHRTVALKIIGVILCLFTLAEVNYPHLTPQSQLALFAMLGMVLCFLHYPIHSRWREHWLARASDLVLCGLTVAACGYIVTQSDPVFRNWWMDGQSLGNRAGREGAVDFGIGLVLAVLVLEATRRSIGLALPILSAVFVAYALWGTHLPNWLFPHRGYSVERTISQTVLQGQGVFGVALRVMFTYVFLFIVFGAFLKATGASQFIIDFARRLFRRSLGGPAKVSVLSSGLMGSLSGSAVANTATTGTFTIPMMRASGFRPEMAGGIEAAASSGGALVPPVMGAAAYMMLEIVTPPVTYLQIIKAALLPAVLYYFSLLLIVHFYSKKLAGVGASTEGQGDRSAGLRAGANPTSRANAPGAETGAPVRAKGGMASGTGGDTVAATSQKDGEDTHATTDGKNDTAPWFSFAGVIFAGAFVSLLLFLFLGYTAFRAVSLSLGVVLVLSCFNRSTRLTWRRLVGALEQSGKDVIPLVCASACVGIVIGVVTLTGVGTRFPAMILPLAEGSLFLALLVIMLSSIVLGLGLPSVVCYLLMATLIGPALGKLGVVPLAAHLFIFYFGMMSMVTPPVALAAYTASSIAGSPIMATSFAAFRFALVGFTLPFIFVYRPELLMLTHDGGTAAWTHVAYALAVGAVGITCFAAGLSGHLFNPLSRWFRILMFAAAGLLLFPGKAMLIAGLPIPAHDAAGGVMFGVLCFLNWRRREG